MHEKLKFEQIKKDSCASLRYDYSSLYPKDEMPLHFHPEIEICYVVKGSGYRMIGRLSGAVRGGRSRTGPDQPTTLLDV